MLTAEGIRQGIYRSETMRRFAQWLDVAPHPLTACEIAGGYIAAARWNRAGVGIESLAVEPLSPGAIKPSAVDTNVSNPSEVRSALEKVLARVHVKTRFSCPIQSFASLYCISMFFLVPSTRRCPYCDGA
jgi:hypothetical protein